MGSREGTEDYRSPREGSESQERQAANSFDINRIIAYKRLTASIMNAQAEQAELWQTMTPDERRYATSPNIQPSIPGL